MTTAKNMVDGEKMIEKESSRREETATVVAVYHQMTVTIIVMMGTLLKIMVDKRDHNTMIEERLTL